MRVKAIPVSKYKAHANFEERKPMLPIYITSLVLKAVELATWEKKILTKYN